MAPASASGPAAPGWADVRQAVMSAAEACADAVAGLSVHGAGRRYEGTRAVLDAVSALRDLGGCLRPLAFDEAVIEAEAARRAQEILAAAGVVPPPRGRHLHVVS